MYEEQKREAYYQIPQRKHTYPASDKAKEIVKKSITIDTLFSGVVPSRCTSVAGGERVSDDHQRV